MLVATAGESVGVGYFGGGEGWVVESLPWGEEEVGDDEIEVAWWMPVPPPPSWQGCLTGEADGQGTNLVPFRRRR